LHRNSFKLGASFLKIVYVFFVDSRFKRQKISVAKKAKKIIEDHSKRPGLGFGRLNIPTTTIKLLQCRLE